MKSRYFARYSHYYSIKFYELNRLSYDSACLEVGPIFGPDLFCAVLDCKNLVEVHLLTLITEHHTNSYIINPTQKPDICTQGRMK